MVGGGEQLFRVGRERNTLALVRALSHDWNGRVAEGGRSDGRSVERNDVLCIYMYEGLTATPIQETKRIRPNPKCQSVNNSNFLCTVS